MYNNQNCLLLHMITLHISHIMFYEKSKSKLDPRFENLGFGFHWIIQEIQSKSKRFFEIQNKNPRIFIISVFGLIFLPFFADFEHNLLFFPSNFGLTNVYLIYVGLKNVFSKMFIQIQLFFLPRIIKIVYPYIVAHDNSRLGIT